jgi:FkbM family methyltransferase
MKQTLLKYIRRCGIDIHALPLQSLSLRDLRHDLPQLVRKPDPLVFDIGANKGQTIEKMLDIFPKCRLRAFEPDAELASKLKEKYATSIIEIESLAFGSNPGQIQFIQYENNELNSFLELTRNPSNPFSAVKVKSQKMVQVDTVDNYCRANGIQAVDILKVDTQGFDLEVLKGAEALLATKAISVVLVEVNFMLLYKSQCTAGQLIDWLGSRGYFPLTFYEQVRQKLALSWVTACFVQS